MSAIRLDDLRSSSHYDVANALSDALIELVAAQKPLGGKPVADALRQVRDVIWSPLEKGAIAFAESEEKKRSTVYERVLPIMAAANARSQFLEAYARLGHIYELASLIARENTISRELEGFAPGGVREFVSTCCTAQEAATALSKPVFEMVMTAHPTNVNALNSIKAQRALGKCIDAARESQGTAEQVQEALSYYITTPLVPGKDGEMENLTVQDETEVTLYYLCNLYEDLPDVYAGMEDALSRKGDYDRLSLNLKLRFGSWGSSGDKDGNAKVNANTTLDAIIRHKCAILDRYTESLRQINLPSLSPWLSIIDTARTSTASLQTRIIAHEEHGGATPAQFEQISRELMECSLDATAFEYAVAQSYRDTHRQDVLELVRRIRIFGSSFAKIEYRENAEEYTRVVSELIVGYEDKPLDERTTLLTELLLHPQDIAVLYAAAKERLQTRGADKAYTDSDAAPIAYQTLRRMELARDFPKIIRDNVLAEFTHPSQLLEAVFLQAAVMRDNSRALLGVVPLFESPESMGEAAGMMDVLYENPAYRRHMQAIARRDGLDTPVQQIQIAHSDNARRSGLPAARAYIHETHRQLRDSAEAHGVTIQFFEGGSSSDIYRGGVRATSAAVRAYGLHDFAKFTFQGGDMLNYLNYAPSSKRLFVRNFAHSAAFHVHGVELASTTSWEQRESAPKYATRDAQTVQLADTVVTTALKATLDDYRDHAFTHAGLGHLLRELEYDEEKVAGTAGSRAPSRGKPSEKAEDKTAVPRAITSKPLPEAEEVVFAKVRRTSMMRPKSVDIHKTRTITFSEALQHGGLVPTIVGSRTIYSHLRDEVNTLRAAIIAKTATGEGLTAAESTLLSYYREDSGARAPLPAGAIRFLFKQSRLLRDVVIRMAIGVALTDFESMRAHHFHLRSDPFLDQLEDECREAANIVCACFTGHYPEALLTGTQGRKGFNALSTNQLRHLMVARFPEMQQVLEDKSRYMGFLQTLKAAARNRTHQNTGMDAYSRRLTHTAGDTVIHGRMVPTDDPAYGRYLRQKLRKVLELKPMESVHQSA